MNAPSTHKKKDFWIFGLFFFLYFFIMATCFPFLPVWLSDVVGLSKTDTGIVFSCLSLFAISFQPLLGIISDRLGLRRVRISTLHNETEKFSLLNSNAYKGAFLCLVTYSHLP
ncbi:MFS transporter [Aeromonas veronii]|uniref:MFS transporter n=1 Tax=Aeromonas veronii TaxID=654 RepID=UPI003D1F1CBB